MEISTEMTRARVSVSDRFIYTRDKKRLDYWRVTTNGGMIRDDCDGYALTLLYELAGRSWIKFWWLQITFQACIWHARSYNGGGHAILWYKGWWTDNMEHRWYRTSAMRHTRKFPYLFPMTAVKLLLGKVL